MFLFVVEGDELDECMGVLSHFLDVGLLLGDVAGRVDDADGGACLVVDDAGVEAFGEEEEFFLVLGEVGLAREEMLADDAQLAGDGEDFWGGGLELLFCHCCAA